MSHRVADVGVLALVGALTVAPYVLQLGFYTDDWTPIARWSTTPDRSFWGLLTNIESNDALTRPFFFGLAAVVFYVFGAYPQAFHLVNSAVLTLAGVSLFLVLARFNLGRLSAFAVAAIYITLPHYATTRFWLSAAALNLSLLLFLAGTYADLRSLRHRGRARVWWTVAWAVAVAASLLSYETVLPLILVTPLVARVFVSDADTPGPWTVALRQVAITGLVVAPVLAWKVAHTARLTDVALAERVDWFAEFLGRAGKVAVVDLGLGLPRVVASALQLHPSPFVLLCCASVGVLLFLHLSRGGDIGALRLRPAAAWTIGGVAVWVLSLALFFITRGPAPGGSGVGNRLVSVASVGVAMSIVGVGGLVSGLVRPSIRRYLFCLVIALHGAAGTLVIGALAGYWVAAAREQERILAAIREDFPDRLPPGALILDGVCPYIGPGIVFEASWDFRSALALEYSTWSGRANVLTSNLSVEREGLQTSMYDGFLTRTYPYGDLHVYDIRTRHRVHLADEDTARRYFADRRPPDCPAGREGGGVPVLGLPQ